MTIYLVSEIMINFQLKIQNKLNMPRPKNFTVQGEINFSLFWWENKISIVNFFLFQNIIKSVVV